MYTITYPTSDKSELEKSSLSDIIVLAAGSGTRMVSAKPKALQMLAGRPLIEHLLIRASGAFPEAKIHVVVAPSTEKELAAQYGKEFNVNWVVQKEQNGTAHAVECCLDALDPKGCALVLYADVPLIPAHELGALVKLAEPKSMALLGAWLPGPYGYGRIVCDDKGLIARIVEEADASPEERGINDVNTGVMAIPVELLRSQLGKISKENAQGEAYLTDIVALARAEQYEVRMHQIDAYYARVIGINNKVELAEAERWVQMHQSYQLAARGVTFRDLNRFDLCGSIQVGHDVEIDVNVTMEGENYIADGVKIGANCVLKDVHIEAGTVIKPFSLLEGAQVGRECVVGPYARLRPQTQLADQVHIGNYVEVKNSTIDSGSKINHLSYVGDSEVGKDVNIGAGVITCNYDGVNKNKTHIEDGAFIGSNTSLVAPVRIGAGATVAAGSAISKDVPAKALGITRAEQKTRENWNPKK